MQTTLTRYPRCYLTPAGMATVKAAAALMGAHLRTLRAERETARVLERAALPALPTFTLKVPE